MNRAFIILCLLIIHTLVYANGTTGLLPAQSNINNGIKAAKFYKITILSGENQIPIDNVEKYATTSCEILPLSGVSGGGLSVGYINVHSGYPDADMVYIQPSFILAPTYFSLRFGFAIYYELESVEDSPGGFVLPHGELKIGNLKKIYICGSAMTDIFWGLGTIGLVYECNDQVANIMLGVACGYNWEYSSYDCNFDVKLTPWCFSRLRGIANFHKHLYGFQVGLGVLL